MNPIGWLMLDILSNDGVITDIPSPHHSFFRRVEFVVDATQLAPLLEVLESSFSEVWGAHITSDPQVCSRRFSGDPRVPLAL